MFSLAYHRPATLAEARAAQEAAEDGLYLSGGHTLIPALKNRLLAPSDLVDLRGIPGLGGIEAGPAGGLRIGATTRHVEVARSPLVRAAIPALAGLAGSIGDRQVRNMGTIGGSIANNDPAADYPSALLALAATVETDRRSLPAAEFFAGLYETALEPGEIVTAVHFPAAGFAAYAKLRSTASRYSVVGVFVARTDPGGLRVAVTGAGADGVFRAAPLEAALAGGTDPAALAGCGLGPEGLLSDGSATAEFRAHLIVELCREALAHPGQARVIA